ncbi:hypothetical protein BB559_002356 [Furculomyces boomerangus]|uniref:PCI domain-containing protein n=1 Tax=Furculomyces boomerangus TaxID=61424 RepID=A0A2T9YW19_9FUNG|nr:hypothetical protein BB559_002356 [Furculomyces boomerangus]
MNNLFSFKQYFTAINISYKNKDSKSFQTLFPATNDSILDLYSKIQSKLPIPTFLWGDFSESTLIEFVKAYTSFVISYPNSSNFERWICSLQVLNMLIPAFTRHDAFWLVQTVKSLTKCSFLLYYSIPKKQRQMDANKMGELLQRIIKVQMSDRTPLPNSKRAGVYSIVNMFLHFSIESGSMGPLVGLISNICTSGPPIEEFPISDQVSFSYWLGRYYLIRHQLRQAQNEFEFALEHCPKEHIKNKRIIVEYAIVVNILRGKLPTDTLLEKYGLSYIYSQLVFYYHKGFVGKFKELLKVNFEHFRKLGVYLLLLERSEIPLYRNLILRLFRVKKTIQSESFVLTFEEILSSMTLSTESNEFDYNDVECILSNLIEQGFIRGHIQPQQNILVLSRTNPFPRIKDIKPPIGLPV